MTMKNTQADSPKILPRRDFLKRVSGATAAVAATAALKPRVFGQAPSANVAGAKAVGIDAIQFSGASALRAALHLKGYPLKLSESLLRDAVRELAADGSSEEEGGPGDDESAGGGKSQSRL